mmetsp:Transcript_52570/g.140066  ORF Transcript_52570/g.140066 Transcript_52570/m.140066 type:complete len:88 (-) Transcript_52570:56-319(-)
MCFQSQCDSRRATRDACQYVHFSIFSASDSFVGLARRRSSWAKSFVDWTLLLPSTSLNLIVSFPRFRVPSAVGKSDDGTHFLPQPED